MNALTLVLIGAGLALLPNLSSAAPGVAAQGTGAADHPGTRPSDLGDAQLLRVAREFLQRVEAGADEQAREFGDSASLAEHSPERFVESLRAVRDKHDLSDTLPIAGLITARAKGERDGPPRAALISGREKRPHGVAGRNGTVALELIRRDGTWRISSVRALPAEQSPSEFLAGFRAAAAVDPRPVSSTVRGLLVSVDKTSVVVRLEGKGSDAAREWTFSVDAQTEVSRREHIDRKRGADVLRVVRDTPGSPDDLKVGRRVSVTSAEDGSGAARRIAVLPAPASDNGGL